MIATLRLRVRGWLVALLVAPLRAYQYAISPMLPARCRFFPSCSGYAIEALQRHGPLRGGLLAAARVCRCNPWNDGGVDPVPDQPKPFARAAFARWPAALRGDPPARTE
ncbi:MAG TPA: membrane protein insertion efficiency factor YidD [Burkholderiaceae bacterium]